MNLKPDIKAKITLAGRNRVCSGYGPGHSQVNIIYAAEGGINYEKESI